MFEIVLNGGLDTHLRLMWLFVIVITVLMLFLCYLYLSMRSAEKREAQSEAFSGMVIEGLEMERRRVSRELHDSALPLCKDTELANIIRSICMELAPPDFTRLSLKNSLSDLCAQFTQKTKIKCAVFIEENLDFAWLGPENQLHLYRIIQEAFTNIEKHAKTEKAVLVARRDADHVLIYVSDEGVGLSDLNGGQGLGMASIRQRAAIIGAKLDFVSEAGHGVTVNIQLTPPIERT